MVSITHLAVDVTYIDITSTRYFLWFNFRYVYSTGEYWGDKIKANPNLNCNIEMVIKYKFLGLLCLLYFIVGLNYCVLPVYTNHVYLRSHFLLKEVPMKVCGWYHIIGHTTIVCGFLPWWILLIIPTPSIYNLTYYQILQLYKMWYKLALLYSHNSKLVPLPFPPGHYSSDNDSSGSAI